jgi:hypothetical protein
MTMYEYLQHNIVAVLNEPAGDHGSIEGENPDPRAHRCGCQKLGISGSRWTSAISSPRLHVDCGKCPTGWETHGPSAPIGPRRVAGRAVMPGTPTNAPRARFSAKMLAQTTNFKTSAIRCSRACSNERGNSDPESGDWRSRSFRHACIPPLCHSSNGDERSEHKGRFQRARAPGAQVRP